MTKTYTFIVFDDEVGLRIDHFLKAKLPELTRSRIQKLIEEGLVTSQGVSLKAAKKTQKNMEISVQIPPEESLDLIPEEVPLDILYEDDDLAVIFKPASVVVHPAPGHSKGTLVHGLLLRLKNLSGIGGKLRPGIVHRLDKDTSGLMIVAKNDKSHQALINSFKKREIQKEYLALTYGHIKPPRGKIEKPIGRHPKIRNKMATLTIGKEAITEYEVIKYFKRASLVLAKPITGRTHQLRVHFSSLGHPILGDPLYGGQKRDLPKAPRLMLHAAKISFFHPSKKTILSFEKEPPSDFQEYLKVLEDD